MEQNTDLILSEIDRLWGNGDTEEVERFMTEQLTAALEREDTAPVLLLLNEMIGFYRDICAYDKSLLYAEKAIRRMCD